MPQQFSAFSRAEMCSGVQGFACTESTAAQAFFAIGQNAFKMGAAPAMKPERPELR
jgi:hypothetical protein